MFSQSTRLRGELRWNIYTRFREYVKSLPDGREQWLSGEGGLESDAVVFELEPSSYFDSEQGSGTLKFVGSLRFSGYRGMLYVTVSDPWIVITPEKIEISVDSSSSGDPARLVIAESIAGGPVRARARLNWSDVPTELTEDGSVLLGGVYSAGTSLDDLHVWITNESTGDGR
ncbi:hypothetical protein BH09ACT6_BH09ACT6_04850 [soil metagenome]